MAPACSERKAGIVAAPSLGKHPDSSGPVEFMTLVTILIKSRWVTRTPGEIAKRLR